MYTGVKLNDVHNKSKKRNYVFIDLVLIASENKKRFPEMNKLNQKPMPNYVVKWVAFYQMMHLRRWSASWKNEQMDFQGCLHLKNNLRSTEPTNQKIS